MGEDVGEDITFDVELEDGRIAHCWRASNREYQDCVWSAGLVQGIEPDIFYLRVERGPEKQKEPLTLFVRSDELLAIMSVASDALWSAEMMRMGEVNVNEETYRE